MVVLFWEKKNLFLNATLYGALYVLIHVYLCIHLSFVFLFMLASWVSWKYTHIYCSTYNIYCSNVQSFFVCVFLKEINTFKNVLNWFTVTNLMIIIMSLPTLIQDNSQDDSSSNYTHFKDDSYLCSSNLTFHNRDHIHWVMIMNTWTQFPYFQAHRFSYTVTPIII